MNTPDQKKELRIGRLMAAGLEEMAADTPCLTEDQLDALVAGTIPKAERDTALSHISGCSECRHALVVTHRLAQVDEPVESKVIPIAKHKHYAWNYTVPLALAATLLLAISLYRFIPGNSDIPLPGLPGTKPPTGEVAKVEPQPQAPQVAQQREAVRKPNRQNTLMAMAGTLGKAGRGKEADIPFVSANQAGFAGDGEVEANLFHTGFALFALASACESGDTATVHRAAASLKERMDKLSLTESDRGTLLLKAEKLITDAPTPEACRTLYAASMNAIEKQTPNDLHLNLGFWIAALRISAQQKQSIILFDAVFMETIRMGANLAKPGGVAKKLAEVATIAGSSLDEKAWSRLEELADDVQKRF